MYIVYNGITMFIVYNLPNSDCVLISNYKFVHIAIHSGIYEHCYRPGDFHTSFCLHNNLFIPLTRSHHLETSLLITGFQLQPLKVKLNQLHSLHSRRLHVHRPGSRTPPWRHYLQMAGTSTAMICATL